MSLVNFFSNRDAKKNWPLILLSLVTNKLKSVIGFLFLVALLPACVSLRGTGDLGVIIEREKGNIKVVETTHKTTLGTVQGLGDLSHASLVYSRDGRYAFIFGRDGGLTKVDILKQQLVKRVMQAGNSIGGAISQDGSLVAVSNYEPGGVRVFKTSDLSMVADIPALAANGKISKTVGLVDAPHNVFVYSLFEGSEIWVLDMADVANPRVSKFTNIGKEPYDGLVTPEGRYYVAGLFGEDGLALLDLWNLDAGVKRILPDYGKGKEKLPVYKMPHFEGWAISNGMAFVPAVGQHEVIVVQLPEWKEIKRIATHGQPVFAMASPDGRQVWVNYALPDNDTVEVVDVPQLKIVKVLKPGKAVLHMEFTPKGENVWVSVRDEDRVEIYDTQNFEKLGTLKTDKPSGIFFTNRANKIGL
jgi:protein NirF